jgi:hypothetical protein
LEGKKVSALQAISIQQPKKRAAKATLSIASEIDLPKVRMFLESVARNSRNSKASYEIGLKHLQRFLASSSSSNYYKNYNVEPILSSLKTGSATIYTSCWTGLSSILSSCPMSRLLRADLCYTLLYLWNQVVCPIPWRWRKPSKMRMFFSLGTFWARTLRLYDANLTRPLLELMTAEKLLVKVMNSRQFLSWYLTITDTWLYEITHL